MYLFGRILDSKGRPIAGATVEVWHADNSGRYKHPRAPEQKSLDESFSYFGKVKTAKDGSYLFKSIIPRWYNLLDIRRLRLTPDSAACNASIRCTSGGTLTTKRPLYFRSEYGAGGFSPDLAKSLSVACTSLRIPIRAFTTRFFHRFLAEFDEFFCLISCR